MTGLDRYALVRRPERIWKLADDVQARLEAN